MRDDEREQLYRSDVRATAHRAHRELSTAAEGLDDNTLGGLARTLVGLIADGADPRQKVALEVIGGAGTHYRTITYDVRGDGTGEAEEVALTTNLNTLRDK